MNNTWDKKDSRLKRSFLQFPDFSSSLKTSSASSSSSLSENNGFLKTASFWSKQKFKKIISNEKK